jgi:DNA-binding transcriptional MerR regulator
MTRTPSQRSVGPTPLRGPYRIHVVAEMTGVPAATLRAWERRYGIPSPERTASGYRLYGEHEVELVRRMNDQVTSGVSAQDAARQVLAEAPAAAPIHEGAKDPALLDPFAAASARIVDAVVRFDEVGIQDELRRALFLGSASQVADRVLGTALREVGELWHAGTLSIAQEHLATEHVAAVVRDLVQLARRDDAEHSVLCACFADEDHVIGLLSTAVQIATWGLRPVVLGARTPPSAIRDSIRALSPSIVALSVTIPPNPARQRELLDEYAAACDGVPWLVGGHAAAAMAGAIEARGGALAPSNVNDLRKLVQQMLRETKSPRERHEPSQPEPTKRKRP